MKGFKRTGGALLAGYDKVVVDYLDRVGEHFGPAFLPPAWATELNTITQNVDSKVIFGDSTPAEAAADWLTQMEAAKAAST